MSSPSVARRTTYAAWRPVGMAAVLLAVLALAVLLASWLTGGPAGPTLVIEKPTGGTIVARGINCGTRGSACTTTGTQAEVIELQVEPDDQYTFARYTGDCAPGGRVLMDGPHTCGAVFELVQGTADVRWPLTLTPPANGTIFTIEGHACGTQGTACTVEVAEGHTVSLDVQPDEGFRVQSYTGDCLADGTTTMDRARTCGAVLVAGAGPPPPRPQAERDLASVKGGRGSSGPGGTSDSGGAGSQSRGAGVAAGGPTSRADASAPSPSGVSAPAGDATDAALPPSAPAVSGPPPPVRTPTEIATTEVTALLQDYRDAHSRMDLPAMKRLFPSVDVPRFEQQFRDLKSLKYAFAGDPKLELDLERGRATVVVDVKTENESKAGKKQKPVESKATFLLQRIGMTPQWHIQLIKYEAK